MAVKIKGTVRPKGAKWEFVVDVGKHPITKRRMQETGTCNSEEEAQHALIEINQRLRLGQKIDRTCLNAFVRNYFENIVKHTVGETTYETQMSYIEHIFDYFDDNKRIDEVTHDDIEDFYLHLLNDKELSKGTIRSIEMCLRKSFNYAILKKKIVYNVCRDVKTFTYEPPEKQV